MDKFLEKQSLLKLTQEEIGKLSSPVSNKEIELKKSLPTKKTPGPDISRE